jgi:mono/diheme cytochrome c family protein
MRGEWRRKASVFILVLFSAGPMGLFGCSKDMQDQPSFQPQEGPRLHSPVGSVPRESREALVSIPPSTPERVSRGAALFEINCSQCHGKAGLGDGLVGVHLIVPPANLHSNETAGQPASHIYEVVTKGKELMPAFKGELSAEERWAVAYFVKSFGPGSSPPVQKE